MIKDYKEYLKQQIVRAESKWGRKWGYDEIFKQQLNLSIDDIEEFINPTSICCMGVRTGTECFEFKERYPKAEVYGVDITENINTIRTHLDVKIFLQDFNNLPESWGDKFDLVFSNSLDHSYNPADTIKEWHRVTQNGGHLFLEFSTTPANKIEWSFTPEQLGKLFRPSDFETVVTWESPERNIFTGLFKVKK
jgi:SAM-dependent methyltransferase